MGTGCCWEPGLGLNNDLVICWKVGEDPVLTMEAFCRDFPESQQLCNMHICFAVDTRVGSQVIMGQVI